jgi:hypothetical protein
MGTMLSRLLDRPVLVDEPGGARFCFITILTILMTNDNMIISLFG